MGRIWDADGAGIGDVLENERHARQLPRRLVRDKDRVGNIS
jgi:hypothetical protein